MQNEKTKKDSNKRTFFVMLILQALGLLLAWLGARELTVLSFLYAPALCLLLVRLFLNKPGPLAFGGVLIGLGLAFFEKNAYFPAVACLYLLPVLLFLPCFYKKAPKAVCTVACGMGYTLSFLLFPVLFVIRNFRIPAGGHGETVLLAFQDMLVQAGSRISENYATFFSSQTTLTLIRQGVRLMPGALLVLGLYSAHFTVGLFKSWWIYAGLKRFCNWHLRPSAVGAGIALVCFVLARFPWGDWQLVSVVVKNLDLFFTHLFFLTGLSLFLEKRAEAGAPIGKGRLCLVGIGILFLCAVSPMVYLIFSMLFYLLFLWAAISAIRERNEWKG